MDLSGFSFLKFVSRTLGPGGSKKNRRCERFTLRLELERFNRKQTVKLSAQR
jgi:hypothetical protein